MVIRDLRHGTLTAGFLAVVGAAPWVTGWLMRTRPPHAEASAEHWVLYAALLAAIVTVVVTSFRIAMYTSGPESSARETARLYQDRYLTDADLDVSSRVLLRRAQDAIDTITASQVCRGGVLDTPAIHSVLAEQEWISLAVFAIWQSCAAHLVSCTTFPPMWLLPVSPARAAKKNNRSSKISPAG